ncbi:MULTISPECIES: hypothetical protein [unclassified Rhizobium]|uniref:hypothetical protein n=1 Tax=unclassified Rhizobium TaxID=2613769 RepID=UPI000CF2F014|nr:MULTISPECIES: hypothetical protein [Rhizobium]UWU25981.1 hypothetical protein N2601_33480 [Rhizobium tropici]
MIARFVHERDIPLGSEALGTCQVAFDAVLAALEIKREHEKADVVAALIVNLYQQGIHDGEKLFELVMTASANLKI